MKEEKVYLSIKSWSEGDRPREKMMLKGIGSLSDSELIAILIGSGTRDLSAVEVSKQILQASDNNLANLGKRTINELMKHKGIGEAKAITIVASMELARRRMLTSSNEIVAITSSKEAYDLIGPQLMDLPHEEFWVLLLNKGMHLIRKINIGSGGVGGVVVDKSIIFKHAIENLASSIILVHNHPSGRIQPSRQDNTVTAELVSGGKILGITIADHIIVGGNRYYSYLDEGLI